MAAKFDNGSTELQTPFAMVAGAAPGFLAGWSTWNYVFALLLGVVVYDQGTSDVDL